MAHSTRKGTYEIEKMEIRLLSEAINLQKYHI